MHGRKRKRCGDNISEVSSECEGATSKKSKKKESAVADSGNEATNGFFSSQNITKARGKQGNETMTNHTSSAPLPAISDEDKNRTNSGNCNGWDSQLNTPSTSSQGLTGIQTSRATRNNVLDCPTDEEILVTKERELLKIIISNEKRYNILTFKVCNHLSISAYSLAFSCPTSLL